MFSYVVE